MIFKLGVDLVLCCLVCPQVCIVPKVKLDRRVDQYGRTGGIRSGLSDHQKGGRETCDRASLGDNPKFVEDSVRDLANTLKNEPRIVWFRCSSENFESIHHHNAHAEIEFDKALG